MIYALLGDKHAPVSLKGTTRQQPMNAAGPNVSV